MIQLMQTQTGHFLPAIHDGFQWRLLGRLVGTNSINLTAFGDNNPVFDLSTLEPYDRYQTGVPILDQSQTGSCCAHAHTTMVLKARDLQGMTFEALSADSLYAQIDNDTDQGSIPEDAIKALQTNGVCLLQDVPDNFVLWKNISDAAKQNALRFRIPTTSVYQCKNFQELVSADYLGFAVTLTVNVGNDFNNLSSEGVVPFAPGYANHSVSGGEAFKRLSNGTPAYRFRNSWASSWGLNGCAWITSQHIDQQPGVELYSLKWTLVDPNDPNGNLPF